MNGLGFIESPLDPRDIVFKTQQIFPTEYKLKNVHSVVDQGIDPICAAISLSHIMEWQNKAKGQKIKATPKQIYDLRLDKKMQGMIPREALSELKKKGIDGFNIGSYARVEDVDSAKAAIQMNGPIMICMRAYNNDKFWIPKGRTIGGHATILTGWDKDGFILQNSWGFNWGNGGTMVFPESDFKYALECWTIMI